MTSSVIGKLFFATFLKQQSSYLFTGNGDSLQKEEKKNPISTLFLIRNFFPSNWNETIVAWLIVKVATRENARTIFMESWESQWWLKKMEILEEIESAL